MTPRRLSLLALASLSTLAGCPARIAPASDRDDPAPTAAQVGVAAPTASSSASTRASQSSAPPPQPASSEAAGMAGAAGAAADSAGGAAGPPGGASAAGGASGAGGAGGAGGASAPCDEGMVQIGRYCIDLYEAHLVTRSPSGAVSVHPHNKRPEEGVRYMARASKGAYPQGYISRVEAEAACKEAGKRLCSLGEWDRACGGKRHTLYPYGGKGKQGACNIGKIHLLQKLWGTNPRGWKYDEHFNNPSLLVEPGFLARSGEYEECHSDEGVSDMAGNLHEWVSDKVTDDLVERLAGEPYERKKQPWHEGNGIFMGGFFSTTKEHGPGCKFITIAHEPRYHDYSIGFRCCGDARLPEAEKPKKKRKGR